VRIRNLAAALTGACAAALLALSAAPPAGAQANSSLDPDQIFRAARKAWSFTAYPRYTTYTIVTRYRSGTTSVVRHYDAIEDMRREIVFARTFSHEEIADPSIPHGFNLQVGSLNGQGGVTANPPQNADVIGPLALGVNYAFGISLLPQKTNVVSSTHDIEFPPNLPVIGITGTTTRDYRVRLIELLDAGKTYHLGLEPARDPSRLRLREMWVDATTFLTRRILVSANFTAAPYTAVPWVIDFTHLGGADYIAKETAEAPLDFGGDVSVPNLTIAFEDLKLLPALPQYGAVGADDSTSALTEP
jgi:hypothetical protein